MNPLQAFRQNYRIWAASRAAPCPIASLSEGVWAQTQGRAEPIEGLACSVLTHDRGVLCVAALYIKHHVVGQHGGHSVDWEKTRPKPSHAPFWLVGDGGERVVVDPRNAIIRLTFSDVSLHPHVNDDNQEVRRFLAEHGVVSTMFMGVGEEVCFLEAIVRPGDHVAVAGVPTMRPCRVPEQETYRDGSSIVAHFASTPETPLVILTPRKR